MLRAEDPTLPLDSEFKQVEDSMQRVIREIPNGPVIIGGFSQGGAIALRFWKQIYMRECWPCSNWNKDR